MKTSRIILIRSLASAALCLGFLNLARAHDLLLQREGSPDQWGPPLNHYALACI
jgi:hypothetical protein